MGRRVQPCRFAERPVHPDVQLGTCSSVGTLDGPDFVQCRQCYDSVTSACAANRLRTEGAALWRAWEKAVCVCVCVCRIQLPRLVGDLCSVLTIGRLWFFPK